MNGCKVCDGFGPDKAGSVCPECGAAPYRPLTLQEVAAAELADDPGYPEWIEAQNAARLERQRAEDAAAALQGIAEGLAN